MARSVLNVVCAATAWSALTDAAVTRQSVLKAKALRLAAPDAEERGVFAVSATASGSGGRGSLLAGLEGWAAAGEAQSQSCGVTQKAVASTNKHERCPEDCPLYVQDRRDEDFCTFRCVKAEECALWNPDTQIADLEKGVCRHCVVSGCKTCDASQPTDVCAVCEALYYLKDGECHFKYGGTWVYAAGGVLAALALAVVAWLVEWCLRPTVNQMGLDYGMQLREATTLKMKKDEHGHRESFPLTTNLTRELVAGPGMKLHFNFQAFLMVWGLFVAGVWMCFAHFVDNDLWIIGTRRFGTPRENCVLVAWGFERQQALMWTKVAFLAIVHLGSFLMCLGFGIYQLRSFQAVDHENKTMKDFAAMIVGLPKVPGSKDVEEELRLVVQQAAGVPCVGVSVAWDFLECADLIDEAVKEDTKAAEQTFRLASGFFADTSEPEHGGLRRRLFRLERWLFGLEPPESVLHEPGRPEAATGDDVRQALLQLVTSPRAFAVFSTQAERDRAVKAVAEAGGLSYEGQRGLAMRCLDAEPDTVLWQWYGHSTASQKTLKLVAGVGMICLACLFWAVVFYSPYAYYMMTFNYENGREPGAIVGLAFSMIVVVGNAIMYEVCARISDWVGFRFKDDAQACYMILYTIACLFNVAMDLVTTYFTAEKIMEGLGFRTYFGVPLHEVTAFTEKFSTYGMQRILASNTFEYAFPSTYLIPFLIEPIPTILVPLFLGRLIVRTHPEVQNADAASWIAMVDFDMGRYADLLLNVILGIMMFYFPGGYTWKLFLAMVACHVWIYVFDHLKVLRAIPACTFASYDVEYFAQALLAPIMGIIPACMVFKANCKFGLPCLKGPWLIAACSAAWLLHTAVHLVVLNYVVPLFGLREPEEDAAKDETFESVAQKVPCSWFTANPIYCLRSKHHYKHQPPCSYFVLGKERYMKSNPAIGCHYEEDPL